MKKILRKIANCFRKFISMFKEEKMIPIPVLTERDKLLENKVALITGGNSGIGFAMAEEFLKAGAKVIIAGTNPEKNRVSIEKLGGGTAVQGIVIDVKNIDSMPEKICAAAQLFPENRIDILVNSAGVVSKSDFMHMTEKEYDSIMDINCKGTYFMSKAVGQFMIEKKIKGHILNVTSSSALRPAWTPYQLSKWAVRGMTLGLADLFLPYGIVVNAIAPGPTMTPMLDKKEGDSIYNETNPSRRYTVPSEIASLAVYMVSGLGDMIVGDTFYVTGGSGIISLHN